MRYIPLLLFLLFPSVAFGQTNYDLSCGNIANLRITHLTVIPEDARLKTVHFYVVRIELKADATPLFSRLVKESGSFFQDKNGVWHAERELAFTATGTLLKTDTPDFLGYDDLGVTLGTSQKQEALETARAVCPALTPQWEDLVYENFFGPQAETSESAFDISCANVSKSLIIRNVDPILRLSAPYGNAYSVQFDLKPEFLAEFQAFVADTRERLAATSVKALPTFTPIRVTTGGSTLRNDLLSIRAHRGKRIITYVFHEEDALALTREVCPTVPVEIIRPPSRSDNSPATHSITRP